jgi:OmcA/MtrC family decaheme c-type cytochrome
VLNSGVSPVTVNSAPKVNFTVISDGAVVKGLTTSNASFIIAKLVPGTNGDPDQWSSYTYRTRTGAAGTFTQDYTETAAAATQLVYNEAGYYTYTFSTDITDPTKTNGVVYEPSRTHRVAFQLNYKNKAGTTVRVNPYFDFTIDAAGKSVAVTDSSRTRKVVDITTCNGCHNKLALHGTNRVDTQYCVLCHNAASTDHVTGNVVDFRTMVHKIHTGKYLKEKYGEIYKVENGDFSEVLFPANARNCVKCHDSTTKNAAGNPLNPQGDKWKTTPSKEACLSCHASATGSSWNTLHVTQLKLGASTSSISNAVCESCHGAGKPWNAEQVHWIQELENTKLYQNVIESATLTTKPTATANGVLTVKYAVINPATGAAYDLREGCAANATQKDDAGTLIGVKCNTNYRWWTTTPPGAPQDKFGTSGFTLATNTFTQSTNGDTTNTTSGTGYLGVDDGTHHYTLKLTVPKGAHGNARIVMLGSVSERRLNPVSRAAEGAVPPVGFEDIANVPIKNAIYEFNLDTGAKATTLRRQIVSNDKCNACHAFVGIPIKPEPGSDVFHSGVRNNSENCEVCHNWARAGSYTGMTNGQDFNESWNFKRMIHGIHGGEKRTYPFTHGNDYVGEFGKDGKLLSNPAVSLQSQSGQAAEVINYTAEVAYPQSPSNCNACHVNDSWKQNGAVLGSQLVGTSTSVRNGRFTNPGINHLVSSGACVGQTGSIATLDLACASIDMTKIPVVSPKAAVCTSCHDSLGRQSHVINMGGATFGTMGQGDLFAGKVFEACDGCHEARVGALRPVDAAHGLK